MKAYLVDFIAALVAKVALDCDLGLDVGGARDNAAHGHELAHIGGADLAQPHGLLVRGRDEADLVKAAEKAVELGCVVLVVALCAKLGQTLTALAHELVKRCHNDGAVGAVGGRVGVKSRCRDVDVVVRVVHDVLAQVFVHNVVDEDLQRLALAGGDRAALLHVLVRRQELSEQVWRCGIERRAGGLG